MGNYRYQRWLNNQIASDSHKNYEELFQIMHNKEFVWFVPNDDNRIADGLELRFEFFQRNILINQGCSVLEMIVALSRRVAFAAGGRAENWAWQLIENLELHKMSSHIGRVRADQIDEILERLIWRTYQYDGGGGLFPLSWPIEDQRKVEIWYQMCAYINEIFEP